MRIDESHKHGRLGPVGGNPKGQGRGRTKNSIPLAENGCPHCCRGTRCRSPSESFLWSAGRGRAGCESFLSSIGPRVCPYVRPAVLQRQFCGCSLKSPNGKQLDRGVEGGRNCCPGGRLVSEASEACERGIYYEQERAADSYRLGVDSVAG